MPSPVAWSCLSLAAAFTAASSLAAASPLAAAAAAEENYLTIPIKRRNPSHPQNQKRDDDPAAAFHRKASALRNKYGKTAPNAQGGQRTRPKKRDAAVPLTSYKDSEWFGEIEIGTPANTFSVVLDTGSADLIVAEPNCNGCQSSTPGYSPSSSSTSSSSQQGFSIQYGSGSASGTLVEDRVSIANYTDDNQIFAACSTLNNIVDGSISGILGLGWQNIAQSGAVPLVQGLWQNNKLPQPVFGFAFETHVFYVSSSPTAPGGYLTVGGLNTSQYTGSINWIDLDTPVGYWYIPMQDISVGGQSLGISENQVVIDTGTTLIGMPYDAASAIYNQIPNSRQVQLSGSSGYYSFPCSQTVNVAFQFGGQSYSVDSSQFNAGAVDRTGEYCLGAVFALTSQGSSSAGSSNSPNFIIGDAFLTGVYSAYRFDPPAVGFAQLGSGGKSNVGASASGGSSGSTSAASSSSNTSGAARREAYSKSTTALVALAATGFAAFLFA